MFVLEIFSRFQSRTSYSSTAGVLKRLEKYNVEMIQTGLILTVGVPDFQTIRKIQDDLKLYTGAKTSPTRIMKNKLTGKFEFENVEQYKQCYPEWF